MIDFFAPIQSQPQATSYLRAALAEGLVTHAYLFVGDKASDKEDLALRFAAAIIADGDEAVFKSVLEHSHPDLHVLEPQSSSGYVVEQIRRLVSDCALAPIRAARKVYILHDVQAMGPSAANAYLKTLEEPPADVVSILLATTQAAVLDTIASRCEIIAMNDTESCFVEDPAVCDMLYSLAHGCDDIELFDGAKALVDSAASHIDELEEEQERDLSENAEFYTSAARNELAKKHKRAVSALRKEVLLDRLQTVRAWLRDALVVQQGALELVRMGSCRSQTLDVGSSVEGSSLLAALSAVDSCEHHISCNVSPELAIEAMCMEIREALCQR